MASIRIIRTAMNRAVADPAYDQLSRFIQARSPGIVHREHEKSFYFDEQLQRNAAELHVAKAAVDDFISVRFLFYWPLRYTILMYVH